MKTIMIAYVTNKNITLREAKQLDIYTFNSEDDLKIGDVLDSPDYSCYLYVVKVKNEPTFSETFHVLELSMESKPRTVKYEKVKTL